MSDNVGVIDESQRVGVRVPRQRGPREDFGAAVNRGGISTWRLEREARVARQRTSGEGDSVQNATSMKADSCFDDPRRSGVRAIPRVDRGA